MNKLIFVPTPLTEESPHSLIKRAAQCHGFSTTGKLNGLCIGAQTFRSTSLTQNSDFAKLFVAEAGINGPRVLDGFYATIEKPKQRRRLVIGGIAIPITYIRLRSGAYCDGCFNEGWERQIRDLKFSEFCPYHQKKYLTHCPNCHMLVEWWHALDGKCRHCVKPLKCQSCTLEECRIERMLVELMRTRSQLDFDQLLAITRQLGYIPERPTVPDATRRMIFIGAFSIMTDDSRAILEHLFKLHSLHPDVEKFWIAARFSLVTTPAAREASRIFLETKYKPLPKLPYCHVPFLLTLRQLRSALNTTAAQMAEIKKRTSFARRSIYSCFTVDDASTLANIANEFLLADGGRLPIPKKEMLSRAKACQKLGVSVTALNSYVKYNLLKPYLGYKHAPFFFPSDIEKLSTRYEPFPSLAKITGMSTRRLCVALESMEIKITPSQSLKKSHWLIEKSDVDRVIHAITKKSKKPYQRTPLPSADFSKKPRTDYITVREAAKELQMVVDNVVAAIRINVLKGACHGKKSCLLIPKTAIQKFKSKFMTATQAAKIIKVHCPQLNDLLNGLGVHAIIGPMVDGTPNYIYKAADIMRVAKLAEAEDPSEHFNYCSKYFAANRLHVSTETLLQLMATGFIKYIKGRMSAYFRPSWLNTFEEHFIMPRELLKLAGLAQNMAIQMIDALKNIEIVPIKLKTTDQSLHLFCRATIRDSRDKFFSQMAYLGKCKEYRTYLKHTKKPPPKGYSPLKDIINTYNISGTDISNLFIKFGFINTIVNNKIIYISSDDRKKCESILDNYCTCAMASKSTPGGYRKITNLLRSGILKNENPIPEQYTQTKLISRSKLKIYLDSLPPSRPNEQ
jgi:hypothetical protein